MSNDMQFEGRSVVNLSEDEIRSAVVEYVSRRHNAQCSCGEYRPYIYWEIHSADVSLIHVPGCEYYFKLPHTPELESNPVDEAIEQRRSESQSNAIVDTRELEMEEIKNEIASLIERLAKIEGGGK